MLPLTPPITLLQVYTEFGAPLGTNLNLFYQGGPWVGVGGSNINVPTKPPIGLLNLLGAASGGSTSAFVAAVSTNILVINGMGVNATTSPVTCATSGGVSPVTFLWQLVSGDTGIRINNPTSATTTFSATLRQNSYSGIFQCTCTDNTSHVTNSPTVSVTLNSTFNSRQ